MRKLKVGIDNYGLFPKKMEPLDVLKWAKAHGAEGVQFSGLDEAAARKVDNSYLKDMKDFASSEGLYLEWGGGQHIPRQMATWEKKEIFDNNRKAAEEAEILGVKVIRSCSGGLMRWDPTSPMTETLLIETAEVLSSQRQLLRDHGVILAIETHFEFTSFELYRLFRMCEAEPGDFLGICLDTMNLLTMLEEPHQAVDRILPWVVSTHIKDGAIVLDTDGMVTFPTPIGGGIIDIRSIVVRLAGLDREINLSIEDHGGSFQIPIYDSTFLSKFPDLSVQEFAGLLKLAKETEDLIDKGECSPTDRERWPEICEERLKNDIHNLKQLVKDLGM